MATSTTYCDDAGMAALTLEDGAAKIATAESGFAAATSQYDRNVFAQIRDEFKRYAAEHAKQIEQAAAASPSASLRHRIVAARESLPAFQATALADGPRAARAIRGP